MNYPLTVRQAQKLHNKSQSLWWEEKYREAGKEIARACSDPSVFRETDWDKTEYPGAVQSTLARLAAKHGPNHILLASPEAQSRPKDTDEVRPQSDSPSEDSEFHGGDGASGEVESDPKNSEK